MEKMLIANPIFETVFKYMMENNRVARFFVETIIGLPVESIAVTQQEVIYFKSTPEILSKSGLTDDEIRKLANLSIIRYDFIAIIRTPEGNKKVLIEIQKARNIVDLMRFRTYLAEQYKRKDIVIVRGQEVEATLPIITIYLLGFKLPETDAIAIHVSRTYHDIIAQTELKVKSKFIECLTHDCYIVQIPQIVGKARTRLEMMLNIFEQRCFLDENGILKTFNHEVDDENIRYMLEILYYAGADLELRKAIEIELRSNQLWDEEIVKRDMKISEQQLVIEEKDKALENSIQALENSKQALEDSKQALEEKDKENEELKRLVAALTNQVK